jgi:DNA-3-methyladenine glycosylase I
MKKRCKYLKLTNPNYVKYHDEEWGRPIHDEHDLYELFTLELFQAGLSWECILNKRENFRRAYDNFDINKICNYDEKKVNELMNDKSIIRNKLKIEASISNSKIIKDKIIPKYGSFNNYIWHFTKGKSKWIDVKVTSNKLSDEVSKDMKKLGMKFVGTVTIYSFLQACGVINSHDKDCFVYEELEKNKI